MTSLELSSPCKVNLLLNILGKRADGFHELETVMQPVRLHDKLTFHRTGSDLELTCSEKSLPIDARNLVHRAARAFLDAAGLQEGVKIHLEKRIPLAAGLGGGSGNAATTLLGLNELFGEPLRHEDLHCIASSLGSYHFPERVGRNCEPFSLTPALSRWERENLRTYLAAANQRSAPAGNSMACGAPSPGGRGLG